MSTDEYSYCNFRMYFENNVSFDNHFGLNSPKITLCISRSQDTLIRIWYSPALEYTKSDS